MHLYVVLLLNQQTNGIAVQAAMSEHTVIDSSKVLAIVGTGGFAREVLELALDLLGGRTAARGRVAFYDLKQNISASEIYGFPVHSLDTLDLNSSQVVVAVADPAVRARIVELELAGATFATLVHPSCVISRFVAIGEGSILCAGAIVTCDVVIGRHAHLNLHSSVGHDCRIGDYFTTAPGARISGTCRIGDHVYFGTNAAVKQGLSIAAGTTVGMGCVVVKDIVETGVYIGNPATLLIRK